MVELPEASAAKLLADGKVRVGWIVCRVYTKAMTTRCYRCLGYGHFQGNCGGPDRSRCCYRCGKLDHKAAACTDEPECVLCKDAGVGDQHLKHIPGTHSCKVFLEARVKEKRRSKKRR